MELGVAGEIAVKQFCGTDAIDGAVNGWLKANPDLEVIDIKFSTSATNESYASDILVIYRREIKEDENEDTVQNIGFK